MKGSDSRLLKIILLVFFVLALLYALFEARGMVQGPVIQVPETIVFAETEFITIQGQVERISELRLNGGRISVTEEGFFAEPYVLAHGVNRIVLEARDARGRETREIVEIVYTGETTTPSPRGVGTSSPATTSAVY